MEKLDLHIGRVEAANDSLVTGPITDLSNSIKESSGAVLDTVTPSAKVFAENTIQLARHPWQTTFNKKNWGRLIRTLPVVGLDVLNKAKGLPFRAIDDAITYVVNNNLERAVGATKAVSTTAIANYITSNGETDWKINKILGAIIEGTGDVAGSIIKAPTGAIGLATNKLSKYIGNWGVDKTSKWVEGLRVSENDYIKAPLLQNSGYKSANFKDVDYGNKSANDEDSASEAA